MIDLQQFCDPESSRYAIRQPFVQGGERFATDGRICIAVPATGEPDTESVVGERIPPMAPVMAQWVDSGKWEPLPEVDPHCKCAGTGYTDCELCHGDCDHQCKCGHEHECGACKAGKVVCDCFLKFGQHDVATWIVAKIATLPNVEWIAGETTVSIRFNGGRGLVAPRGRKGREHE